MTIQKGKIRKISGEIKQYEERLLQCDYFIFRNECLHYHPTDEV